MKGTKLFTLGFVAVVILAACSKNDDPGQPAPKEAWISELHENLYGGDKLICQFIYNADNHLSKVIHKSYYPSENSTYVYVEYEYIRGTDGKVTTIKCIDPNFPDFPDSDCNVNVQYTGNNITEMSGNRRTHITWTNDKIVKIEETNYEGYSWVPRTFAYTGGNCVSTETPTDKQTSDGKNIETNYTDTYQCNMDKGNWMSYIPAEYILTLIYYQDYDSYLMSDNELKSHDHTFRKIRYDAATNAKLTEDTGVVKDAYTYSYDTDGLVTGYSILRDVVRNYVDYQNPANNKPYSASHTEEFKIFYKK